MDVHYLTGLLQSDSLKIAEILEALGYEPKDRGGYYQMKNLDGDNPTAIAVWKNSLNYNNYTRAKNGNIITLIMDVKDYSFPQALRWLAKQLGVVNAPKTTIKYPFGGFYRHLQADDTDRVEFKHYTEDDLPPADNFSYRFFLDGVSYQVQEQMGVRYCHEENSILIPVRNINGRVVGCKARKNTDDKDNRWYMYYPYPKSHCLYGFFENYKHIIESGVIIVVEAEKSVLQLQSMGCFLGVALGGHDISKAQAKYIRALNCKRVILALDEDIYEEEVEKQAAKLVGCNVCYIKDRLHQWLPFDSKASPTDFGIDIFKELMKKCLIRYKGGN